MLLSCYVEVSKATAQQQEETDNRGLITASRSIERHQTIDAMKHDACFSLPAEMSAMIATVEENIKVPPKLTVSPKAQRQFVFNKTSCKACHFPHCCCTRDRQIDRQIEQGLMSRSTHYRSLGDDTREITMGQVRPQVLLDWIGYVEVPSVNIIIVHRQIPELKVFGQQGETLHINSEYL